MIPSNIRIYYLKKEYDANENLYQKLYEYSNICHTLPGYEFDANEYLNILFSKNDKII